MTDIFERFSKKEPRYPTSFRQNLIDKFSRGGGGSEEEKFAKGKFFSNYYECFMYAVVLGLKKDYRIKFDRAKEGTKFLLVDAWQPRQMVQFTFMSLITKSDLDLFQLEELSDEEIDKKALELIVLMEEYAHGGFDLMKAKIDEDPNYFVNQFAAVNFLKE